METTRGLMLCPTCWLLPAYCCCKMWHRVETRHRVCIYMHHNEWGRGINSGIALKTSGGAGVYLSGNKDMEAELKQAFDENEESVFILWPPDPEGKSSTRKAPFVSANDLPELYPDAVQKGITIVAIDATWKNARSMVKRLPDHLKRVYIKGGIDGHLPDGTASIPETSGSLLRPVRKYKGFEGRVSTLEAVVGLLRFVGESEDVCEKLLDNLKMKVDAVQAQKNQPPIYGHQIAGPAGRVASPPPPPGPEA
uniref:tRNA-uridine aminocarboxypropyltransferase n=1 Tax=Pyramimonas obovata TaxID=1411642 RepID=A0A7S0WUN7_9CHLO|mmetsp:Transcript_3969/g.8180  ORF Transcript_3969/g.8180 Transcript_3969/m.8180 type:complete len:252 (+) Transcript_3969:1-756(+)